MIVSDAARAAGAEVRLRGAVDVDAGHRLAPRRPPRRPAHRQEARYVPAHRQEARYVPAAAASPAHPPLQAARPCTSVAVAARVSILPISLRHHAVSLFVYRGRVQQHVDGAGSHNRRLPLLAAVSRAAAAVWRWWSRL